ncbi:MAG TPA: homocysteine S-methyltransferase family protein, partial [Gaiellales bacterium]
MPGLLERLDDDGVVLGAEGYLFELERRGYLKSGPYVPEVVLDRPDAVAELHREFLAAGADVMVAFTYYGHEEKLRMIGREGDVEALNRQALRLARETASAGGAMLAGNICNTWAYDPAEPAASGENVRRMYRDQVRWAAEEGADFILSETNDYVGEALIGLEVIREYGLPSVVTFASSEDETIDGFSFEEACKRLEDAGADVVGLNCSRGPATMLPLLERVRAAVTCPIAGQPVPYRTT